MQLAVAELNCTITEKPLCRQKLFLPYLVTVTGQISLMSMIVQIDPFQLCF